MVIHIQRYKEASYKTILCPFSQDLDHFDISDQASLDCRRRTCDSKK